MTVAENLQMLRKMKQANLDKESESMMVIAAEPKSCKLQEVYDQRVENKLVGNHAIDGLDSNNVSLAGGTPHADMQAFNKYTHICPFLHDKAPRDCIKSPSWNLQRKICQQIEYYFGDCNLLRDKFMLDLMLEDEGWISISKMTTFPQLAAMSNDRDVIMDAIQNFGNKTLLEVNHKLCRIRRNPKNPLPTYIEKWLRNVESCSLFIAGFSRSVTQDELMNFFNKNFEGICNMQMRRREHDSKDDPNFSPSFIGSCFITFETREAAKKLYERRHGLMYKTRSLLTMWKSDFHFQRSNPKDELDEFILDRTMWVHGFDKLTGKKELRMQGKVYRKR